jgi:hydrogenase-4 component B
MSLAANLCVIVFSLSILFALFSVLFKSNWLWSAALIVLGACCTMVGVLGWLEGSIALLPFHIGPYAIEIVMDRLSGVFLILLGTVTCCCGLFSTDYLRHIDDKINGRLYWSALFLFVGAMSAVLCAGEAVSFLIAWEVMALSSAALVVSEYRQHKAQRAAMIYLVATRIATALLCTGFLIMYSHTGRWEFSAWQFNTQSTWAAASLIMTGLCIKAGMWPFHIWLPYAHPEAPSPVSALMSGVMVKVAVYAAVRLFLIGNLNCQPLFYVLFVLATISAFWGVLFAISQSELKRLLAYSTVENVGLILLSLSLCLWAKNTHYPLVSELAFTALILHCVGHGFFKSLLFLCAGSVDYAAHTRELPHLGGLAKNMPVTTAGFILGSAAICALPPLNGFVSKWFLYQALFNSAMTMHSLVDRGLCLAAISILGCVGALAIACFAKATGVAFLGKGRTRAAANAKEAPPLMVAAQLILAAGCVAMGLAATSVVSLLRPVLSPGQQFPPSLALLHTVPLLPIGIGISVLTLLILVVVLAKAPRLYKTWDCGFGSISPKAQVAADSFAQPITRIFTPVFRYSLAIDITGKDKRHFPEKIHVEPSMVSLLETKIYGPVGHSIDMLSIWLARLQAGSIHLYLMYVCISLIVLVLLGTQLW